MSDDKPPVPPDGVISREESTSCFKALIEHWAKARIDGPMQAVARYDEVSKQMATVGSLLLGLLVTAYTAMGRPTGLATHLPGWQRALVYGFLTSLFLFFFCTVMVCWWQPKMHARGIHQFLLKSLKECFTEEELSGFVREWCLDIDAIRRKKKWWLTFACLFFMLCSLLMMSLLLLPLTAA
jgi:hypothetical protein